MARITDVPVELWSYIIEQIFIHKKHKALHGLVMIFNGALGPRVAANARGGYRREERDVFRREWALNHSDNYIVAHAKAREMTVAAWIRHDEERINLHPPPSDDEIAFLRSRLARRQTELSRHRSFLLGTGPPVPGLVDRCDIADMEYLPRSAKPNAVDKIFHRGCLECFQFLFLSNAHPLNIGGYTDRGMSYFGIAAAVPDDNIKERMLTPMVQNATLPELLNIEEISLHDPDGGSQINMLRKIGQWRAPRETWIDRMHTFTVAPPPGMPMQILPITPQQLTSQSSGSEYWLRHLSYNHYLRAYQIGLSFCEIYGHVHNNNSSWYEVLERPQTNDVTQIIAHMCQHSTNGVSVLFSPNPGRAPVPAVNGFPVLANGTKVCPWFMAIWKNQGANGRLFANAPNTNPTRLCTISVPPMPGHMAESKLRLIGYAAIQHMNDQGVDMLRTWVDRAQRLLTQASLESRIIDLLNDILDHFSRMSSAIKQRYAAMMASGAPPPPGTTIQQAEEVEIATLQNHARSMLDILIDRSIRLRRRLMLTASEEFFYETLVDSIEFKVYLRDIIEPRQRSRAPQSRIQKPLLNRIIGKCGRVTRSGRGN
ncbi:hypothetical protein PENSTE_c005G09197 [Penicillium steckii]|uniref:Uncharacterized protein n=1 Tax=Penicillium steckii TaxID=303698 RepID=A0A1V6TK51_9EURO|nr:hypothetical protein PENSTE_c005G09197 [Penicillium steckii]